jgi:hypothetical protein
MTIDAERRVTLNHTIIADYETHFVRYGNTPAYDKVEMLLEFLEAVFMRLWKRTPITSKTEIMPPAFFWVVDNREKFHTYVIIRELFERLIV